MDRSAATRRGRWAFGLTVTACCWGAGLIAAAFLVPVYRGSESWSGGGVTRTTATLVAQNGPWVPGVLALPAVLSLLVWFGLHRRCAHGSRRGGQLAWAAIAALSLLSILAAASVGPFLLPAALLLVLAASLTPGG